MSFGSTLRDWRLEADLSQRELARRVGMDYTYLSKIEAALVAPPSEDKIRAIAGALGRTAQEVDMLLDLARQTRVPNDVVKAALIRNPEVGALLRRITDRPLTNDESQIIRGISDAGSNDKEEGHDAAEPR